MIHNLYSILDAKVGFLPPFVDSNDSSAIRGFHYALTNGGDLMGFAPADFSLYYVGSFATQSGELTHDLPRFIVSGSSLMRGDADA